MVVDIHLDDLGALGEVVEPILRQIAERVQTCAQGEDHVRLGQQHHGGLRALVAYRADGELVRIRESVGMLVGGRDRRAELLRQLADDAGGVRLGHAEAGDDHRVLGPGEHVGGAVERLLVAGTARRHPVLVRLKDGEVALAVEEVARHVHLHRAALGERRTDGVAEGFGDAVRPVHLHLELGDGAEDRQLLDLLEPIQATGGAHRRRCEQDHRRVRVVGRRDTRHHVGDARTVLAGAHAGPARHPRIAVGHVRRGLFVPDGHESDAGGRKEVEGIHVRGAHDAEDLCDALHAEGLDHRLTRGHVCHA